MEIRSWTYEDIYEIAALEQACFRDPWSYRMLADTFFQDSTLALAAFEGGKVLGYGFLVVAGEEADVADIAVAPDSRRRGVGQALLGALEEAAKARGVKKLFLEVRVSNAPAMLLYLRGGFAGSYVRPRYYEDGEDALVMTKRIG